MKGKKENGLYILMGKSISEFAGLVMADSNAEIWLKWFGHIRERGLNELEKNRSVWRKQNCQIGVL